MPLLETKGAASAQGFGQFARSGQAVFIEDVMSVFLYTGNGSTQTITNEIDLSTKGGLVWTKGRSSGAAYNHRLFDTARGTTAALETNTTAASQTFSGVTSFNSNGFTLGSNAGSNQNNETYVSWTFRKQPKFFDVVTYTGDGNYSTDTPAPYGRAIAHSLASRPGFIVIKATSTTSDWYVGARQNDTYWFGSFGTGTSAFRLNGTGGATQYDWATKPMADSTNFYPAFIGAGGSSGTTNDNGVTYVAYLFAHDAGGFGLSGTDNVISCGSFTTDGSGNATVTLNYEPQWVVIKRTDTASNWTTYDTMRGWTVDASAGLFPNTSDVELAASNLLRLNATGFSTISVNTPSSATYIYIAIRRGPMRVPTSGTSVFSPVARSGTGAATTQSTGLNGIDMAFTVPRNAAGNNWLLVDRLRGGAAGSAAAIQTNTTTGESNTGGMSVISNEQNALTYNSNAYNQSGTSYIVECFRRAPGFFDEVCYTGNFSNLTVSHNLGVVPELMIVRNRNGGTWRVLHELNASNFRFMALNDTGASTGATAYSTSALLSAQPTASSFSMGQLSAINDLAPYVAYLFASCPGVSKVGSYTGTGSTLQINCGFTGGARFVLIKRTDSTGDWYVWDTARGIVAGNDPYLLLNSTAAEVTTTDWVDTFSSGFELSNVGGNNVNINTATYIYLAIA